MKGMLGAVLTAFLLLRSADPLVAQQAQVDVAVAVVPEVVTVGEPFTSAVRITAPTGLTIEYGGFAIGDSLQALSPVEVEESVEGAVAVYRLVAWAAGPLEATVAVRLVAADGEARVQLVRIGLPQIRSVLPADSASVEPRPPKGFLELPLPPLPELPWWLWALALVGALLAGMAGYWLLRRSQPDPHQPALSPLDWALAQIDQMSVDDRATSSEAAHAHRRLIWILRSFLERSDQRFGTDLTSSEMVAALAAVGGDPQAVERLRDLLGSADRVKFGAAQTTSDEVMRQIANVRDWIAAFSARQGQPEPLQAA